MIIIGGGSEEELDLHESATTGCLIANWTDSDWPCLILPWWWLPPTATRRLSLVVDVFSWLLRRIMRAENSEWVSALGRHSAYTNNTRLSALRITVSSNCGWWWPRAALGWWWWWRSPQPIYLHIWILYLQYTDKNIIINGNTTGVAVAVAWKSYREESSNLWKYVSIFHMGFAPSRPRVLCSSVHQHSASWALGSQLQKSIYVKNARQARLNSIPTNTIPLGHY